MDKYAPVDSDVQYRTRSRTEFYASAPHSHLNDGGPANDGDLSHGSESQSDQDDSQDDHFQDMDISDSEGETHGSDSSNSESSRSSTPTVPLPPDTSLDEDQRSLYLLMHNLHYGTSEEEAKRNEDLAEIMSDQVPTVTYDQHVRPLSSELFREFNYKKTSFCPSCDGLLQTGYSPCTSAPCPLFNVPRKRSKDMTASEVHLIDTRPQLLDILEEYGDEIIECHGYLHRVQSNNAVPEDRSDTRLYPGYYSSIETNAEYQNNIIVVNVSIASDGFIPKRLSKSEGWPLYVRVEALSRAEKEKYFNSCLAGILYVKGKPSETLLAALSSRLRREMNEFSTHPITLLINGTQWTFRVKVLCGLFDLAGQMDLFGLPRWNSELGCSKCENPGYRQSGKRVWFSAQPHPKRTADSIKRDGIAGQNGVAAYTSFMDLTTPDKCPGDWLHLVSEGTSRDRFRDMTKPTTQMPGIRISTANWAMVTESINRVQNYTYSQKFVLGTTDATKCTGAEFDQICEVVIPLAGARCLMEDDVMAAGLLGYWMTLRCLSDTRALTEGRLRQIKTLCSDVRTLWGELCTDAFTMKLHILFDHVVGEELMEIGSPKLWSTSGFESLHRRLQMNINQSTTNSHTAIIERFVLTKKVYRLFRNDTLSSRNRICEALLEKVENKHVDRVPLGNDGYIVSNECYVPTSSVVDRSVLHAAHLAFVTPQMAALAQMSSRLVVLGQVFASNSYWKRVNLTTQQDIVSYTVDGQPNAFFGSIVLFINLPAAGRSLMLVNEFALGAPFEGLENSVGGMPPDVGTLCALGILDSVSVLNCYFHKVVGANLKLRDSTRIVSPAVVMEYIDSTLNQTFSFVTRC